MKSVDLSDQRAQSYPATENHQVIKDFLLAVGYGSRGRAGCPQGHLRQASAVRLQEGDDERSAATRWSPWLL